MTRRHLCPALAAATLLLATAAQAQEPLAPVRPADPASVPTARPNAAPDAALPSVARHREEKLGPAPSDTSAACRAASRNPSAPGTIAACADSQLPNKKAAPSVPPLVPAPVSSAVPSR